MPNRIIVDDVIDEMLSNIDYIKLKYCIELDRKYYKS